MRITDRDMGNESYSSAIAKAASPAAFASTTIKTSGLVSSASSFSASTFSASTFADDSAHISPAANLVSYTMSLPEVNSGKVNDVQMALASGQFQIDPGRVASALIRTMLDGAWS